MLAIDPALHTTLRVALALLFLAASRHKWGGLAAFRSAVARYRILPERATGPAALGLAAGELGIGLALLVPGLATIAGSAAAWLLALYSAAIAVNLARGRRQIDCGCLGSGARRPLSEALLARNALLLLGAGLCALPVAERPLVWMDALTVAGGVTALALLYGASDAALVNAPRLHASKGSA